MCGSGTTVVECKLLNRNCTGVDINPSATELTVSNLNFPCETKSWTKIYTGDARHLNDIPDDSIDLIATHPPYAGMIAYSKRTIDGDLSALPISKYVQQMCLVAAEAFRVLKPGKYCGILMGDTRKHLHYIPLAFSVMTAFLNSGFLLKEDIIKLQWNMKGTRERWRGRSYDFYKIAHEHLFVFRKPQPEDKLSEYKSSSARLLDNICGQTESP
jgi:DNA modification methylase